MEPPPPPTYLTEEEDHEDDQMLLQALIRENRMQESANAQPIDQPEFVQDRKSVV